MDDRYFDELEGEFIEGSRYADDLTEEEEQEMFDD